LVDRLLEDKASLTSRAAELAAQIRSVADDGSTAAAAAEARAARELKNAKEAWAAAERSRREQWQEAKTKEIKALTGKLFK
jgi:5-azacytidine-induced protein 1